jgi:hypothetical protein
MFVATSASFVPHSIGGTSDESSAGRWMEEDGGWRMELRLSLARFPRSCIRAGDGQTIIAYRFTARSMFYPPSSILAS